MDNAVLTTELDHSLFVPYITTEIGVHMCKIGVHTCKVAVQYNRNAIHMQNIRKAIH